MEVSKRSLTFFLLCCVFLFVCTEVLLSPFYPQFFRKVYGITDPDVTGVYIMTCRLVVVIFTPIWGMLAKKYNSSILLMIGQWGTGLSCFIVAISQTFVMFLTASMLLLLFKSSYFLLYTIMMEQNEGRTTGTAASYHAVLQGAIVTATVLSAWIIQMENPLMIFWMIGLIECFLGLCSYFLLKQTLNKQKISNTRQNVNHDSSLFPHFVKFGIVVLTIHLAVNMIRPFFTTYTENVYHTSEIMSSLLFLIPSLMSIISLPLILRYSEKIGWNGYVFATILMISGLFFQGIETGMVGLIVFRCLFGIGAAWCLAKLDVFLFQKSQNTHGDYSKISAIQNVGLLLAPVAASFIVSNQSISDVFFYASLFVVLHLVVFLWSTFTSERKAGKLHFQKEEKHALYK
ncbi:MFS transporter [Fictibacillus nanhaiensis]|uniref:MFS transporter n=1 Tax=Fictibacillus nanhaiensis TaxID=742169 RepID=UPI001C963BB7|nr:MFS transporter [Fictibacillus nanhaiensis]MBY6037753.1 MFS transporter [Fictibacillus nanhaiensis]